MQIDFEHLELIPKIYEKLQQIEMNLENNYSKRWLNIKEVADYIGNSKDSIHKIKANEWIEGYHYHKKIGKIIFDSYAIDKWILGEDSKSKIQKIDVNQIINSILKDIKIEK